MANTVQVADVQTTQTIEAYMNLKVQIARLNREKKRLEEHIISQVGEGNRFR